MSESKISAAEANDWWRRKDRAGALLNNLMLLFIVVPIALVIQRSYVLSFVVFSLMIPYGLFVRFLAVRAVREYLANHPDEQEEFEQAGIISC